MAPYIFMERNGIHIIDLHKTVAKVDEAAEALKGIAKSGKKILFVATKKQAKEVVAEKAAAVNMPSISDLTRLPSALFVVDVMKEHIAVKEANRLGIPVFGIVDTNSDPKNIDYIIPANDDAKDSVEAILTACCGAIARSVRLRRLTRRLLQSRLKRLLRQSQSVLLVRQKRLQRLRTRHQLLSN